jgi:hypothetical protein
MTPKPRQPPDYPVDPDDQESYRSGYANAFEKDRDPIPVHELGPVGATRRRVRAEAIGDGVGAVNAVKNQKMAKP